MTETKRYTFGKYTNYDDPENDQDYIAARHRFWQAVETELRHYALIRDYRMDELTLRGDHDNPTYMDLYHIPKDQILVKFETEFVNGKVVTDITRLV